MYDFLLDIADQDTIQPAPVIAPVGDRSHLDVYMTRYQRQRQRVYDRARHLVDGRNHSRVEVRDAKAEAGLVGSEARISREQGAQLMWIRSLLQNHGAARYGYSSPLDLVVSQADMHRSTARDLVYLARRLNDGEIERIRAGEISYTRVLEETRLREAGASGEEIARTRDMDLDSVRRVTQKRRKVTRADERKVFESQYVAFQPSLDGTHMRVMGRLGAYEGEICRKALNQLGDELAPAGETRPEAGTRRALALTTLCLDELDRDATSAWAAKRELPPPSSRREPLLMVLADGSLTQASDFEQGAAILAGPRVGPDTIDLILCTGRTANITTTGQHITNHTSTTSIRPGLRRAVLARDDAPSTAAAPPTVSKSTTSSNYPEAGTTRRRTSPPCAGGTTTSPYTAKVCASTPNPHPAEDGYYTPGPTAATNPHPPTPTPSPYSAPSTHPPTEPLPDQDRRPPRRVNGLADRGLRSSLREHGTDQAFPRRSLPGV